MEVFLEEVNGQGGRTLPVNGNMFMTKAAILLLWNLAMVSINSLLRDWVHQADFCPRSIMDNKPNKSFILDRSQPRKTMNAPTAGLWGVSEKYATGVTKV